MQSDKLQIKVFHIQDLEIGNKFKVEGNKLLIKKRNRIW